MTLHDDDIIIAKIEKNSTEEVRVLLRKWKDRWNVDIRVYFPDRDGRMTPSKSGISLNVEKLSELSDAVGLAVQRASERGLVK